MSADGGVDVVMSSMWESIPLWEAWSKSDAGRQQHMPVGVYQYVPKKGEGFPEDFVPFRWGQGQDHRLCQTAWGCYSAAKHTTNMMISKATGVMSPGTVTVCILSLHNHLQGFEASQRCYTLLQNHQPLLVTGRHLTKFFMLC